MRMGPAGWQANGVHTQCPILHLVVCPPLTVLMSCNWRGRIWITKCRFQLCFGCGPCPCYTCSGAIHAKQLVCDSCISTEFLHNFGESAQDGSPGVLTWRESTKINQQVVARKHFSAMERAFLFYFFICIGYPHWRSVPGAAKEPRMFLGWGV